MADEPKTGTREVVYHNTVELAEDRTGLAGQRTVLAGERTFSAWVRTGIAFVAAGLAVARLLRDAEPRWLVLALAAGLVGLGAGALLFGYRSYADTVSDLETYHRPSLPLGLIGVFTAGFVVLAGVSLFFVWRLTGPPAG